MEAEVEEAEGEVEVEEVEVEAEGEQAEMLHNPNKSSSQAKMKGLWDNFPKYSTEIGRASCRERVCSTV